MNIVTSMILIRTMLKMKDPIFVFQSLAELKTD
jgi:hypothetical protein